MKNLKTKKTEMKKINAALATNWKKFKMKY